jgi:hypothetical protein
MYVTVHRPLLDMLADILRRRSNSEAHDQRRDYSTESKRNSERNTRSAVTHSHLKSLIASLLKYFTTLLRRLGIAIDSGLLIHNTLRRWIN